MPDPAGGVTVDANGGVTKSGESGRLYDALVAAYESKHGAIPAGENGAAIKATFAEMAEPIAEWVVDMITDRTKAMIKKDQGGLQTSTAAGNPTDPPNDELFLELV